LAPPYSKAQLCRSRLPGCFLVSPFLRPPWDKAHRKSWSIFTASLGTSGPSSRHCFSSVEVVRRLAPPRRRPGANVLLFPSVLTATLSFRRRVFYAGSERSHRRRPWRVPPTALSLLGSFPQTSFPLLCSGNGVLGVSSSLSSGVGYATQRRRSLCPLPCIWVTL